MLVSWFGGIDEVSKEHFYANLLSNTALTHWGRVTQMCVNKFTIIGSENGLSPIGRQAIIWTIARILLIRTLGINFGEILIQIHTFSNQKNAFENVVWKMSAIWSRPQCVNTQYIFLKILSVNEVKLSETSMQPAMCVCGWHKTVKY